MELIVELTDASMGLSTPAPTHYLLRHAARGIVVNDGKIALIHLVKNRSYKLPGGGVEPQDEDIVATFRREVLEEIGWSIHSPVPIGKTVETKNDPEFSVVQLSTIFIAQAEEDTHRKQLDPEEIFFEYETVWVGVQEAILLLEGNNLERYHTKFTTARDLAILRYVQDKKLI